MKIHKALEMQQRHFTVIAIIVGLNEFYCIGGENSIKVCAKRMLTKNNKYLNLIIKILKENKFYKNYEVPLDRYLWWKVSNGKCHFLEILLIKQQQLQVSVFVCYSFI